MYSKSLEELCQWWQYCCLVFLELDPHEGQKVREELLLCLNFENYLLELSLVLYGSAVLNCDDSFNPKLIVRYLCYWCLIPVAWVPVKIINHCLSRCVLSAHLFSVTLLWKSATTQKSQHRIQKSLKCNIENIYSSFRYHSKCSNCLSHHSTPTLGVLWRSNSTGMLVTGRSRFLL